MKKLTIGLITSITLLSQLSLTASVALRLTGAKHLAAQVATTALKNQPQHLIAAPRHLPVQQFHSSAVQMKDDHSKQRSDEQIGLLHSFAARGHHTESVKKSFTDDPTLITSKANGTSLLQKLFTDTVPCICNGANAMDCSSRCLPAHALIGRDFEHYDIAVTLINLGIPLDESDGKGDTFLHKMTSPPKFTEEKLTDAIQAQTKLAHSTSHRLRSILALQVIAKGAPVNAANAKQETPLHNVLKYSLGSDGTFRLTNALLKAGAKVDVADADGNTPLHYASYNDWSIVASLTSKGAHVRANHKGNTPFHLAAYRNSWAAIEYLIKMDKTEINRVNSAGFSALDIADYFLTAEYIGYEGYPGYEMTRELLVQAGAKNNKFESIKDAQGNVLTGYDEYETEHDGYSLDETAAANKKHPYRRCFVFKKANGELEKHVPNRDRYKKFEQELKDSLDLKNME